MFQRSRLPISERYHGKERRLEHDYAVGQQVLGSGISGEVKVATSLAQPQQKFAVKTIKRSGLLGYLCANGSDCTDPVSEIKNHLSLGHPNIAKLHDVYETNQHFHLVMDCMEGGDLCARLAEKGKFTEAEASKVIRQILSALNHLHKQGITHRDVKLDNVLYDTKTGGHLKLVDFGLSSRKAKMVDCVGSSAYVAPEVLNCVHGRKCSYTSQCDLWSLGVLGVLLLTDEMPFSGSLSGQADIRKGKFTMRPELWHNISDEGKDFIKSLLQVNPSKRLTAAEALGHAWIAMNRDEDSAEVIAKDAARKPSKESGASDDTRVDSDWASESTTDTLLSI